MHMTREARSKRKISRRVRSKRNRRNKTRSSRSYSTRRNKRAKRVIHRGGDVNDLTLVVNEMEKRMPKIKAKMITSNSQSLSDDDIKEITNFFRFITGKSGTTYVVNGQTLTKASCTKFFGHIDCESKKNENYKKAFDIFNDLTENFLEDMTKVATDMNFNNIDALRESIKSKIITRQNFVIKTEEKKPEISSNDDDDDYINKNAALIDLEQNNVFDRTFGNNNKNNDDNYDDDDYTYDGPPQ